MKVKQTTWDLSPLLSGDDDPSIPEQRKEIEKASYAFINKWKDRDDYLTDPKVLRVTLDEYENWERNFSTDGTEGYYFSLRSSQDLTDTEIKAKAKKVEDFAKKIYQDIQFFYLRIAKIPTELQPKFLADANLAPYKHYLERAFAEAKYLLSEPEEKILMRKSSVSYNNWVKMTSTFLSKEEKTVLNEDKKKAKLPFSQILTLMGNKDKQIRDEAAKAIHKITHDNADIAETEVNSILENKQINDELRKMERPDLARHIGDDIEAEVVDTLLEVVSSRFPIVHRYYELKAKLLGLPKLAYHERTVEYGEIDIKYTYEAALNLVSSALGKLDKQFSDIISEYNENGQFDVYPRKGKRSGAFCMHNLISQPTYVFLNYTERMRDVTTLAHELGHGINNELIKAKQNALNFGTPMSTAEVASTFMEDFVLQELMLKASDAERLAIMMMKLDDDVSTIFRQIACYQFEQELHTSFREKGYLSKDEIGKIFQKHMQAYMGDFVEQSKGAENWWVYWSHIRYFFYVYSYASGLLISKSMQASVKEDPAFIEKVKEFLAAGLSDSPKNIFANMGIDITDRKFWDKGLDEVEELLNQTEALAIKLQKV